MKYMMKILERTDRNPNKIFGCIRENQCFPEKRNIYAYQNKMRYFLLKFA